MRILFDSKKQQHKTPFGCIRQKEPCRLTVYIPEACKPVSACICVESEDGFQASFPMEREMAENQYIHYTGEFTLEQCGLYFYTFQIQTEDSAFTLFKQGRDQTNIEAGEKWQITCYAADYDTPAHYKGAVMYQIFPDRFHKAGQPDLAYKLGPYTVHGDMHDTPGYLPNEKGEILNNDFFGGNLKGITEKLDYLQDLGVSVLYLNPIFMAYSNHRYDTADYKTIDPMLGTEQDFTDLCAAAHKRGIRILLDGVFSHTGANSKYFDAFHLFGNGAVSNPNSPYKDWFTFQEFPSKYTAWWGILSLPCVNETQQSYMDYIIDDEDSVVAHWMHLGADGFRLDVADELPDEFIARLYRRVKELNPEGLVLGEVWEDASNKIAYGVRRKYFTAGELDSVMNYPFKNAIIRYVKEEITADIFRDEVLTIVENYPKPILDCVMNILSTHDTARILTVLGADRFDLPKPDKAAYRLNDMALQNALERERLSAFLQFTLPGMACVYYGDEIGMQGFEDPFNRGYFQWDNQNMPLLEFYKQLAKCKNSLAPLRTGDFRVTFCDGHIFQATRTAGSQQVILVTNTGHTPYIFEMGGMQVLFSQNTDFFGEDIVMRRNSFLLLKREL